VLPTESKASEVVSASNQSSSFHLGTLKQTGGPSNESLVTIGIA
jgi:hypothetical protein